MAPNFIVFLLLPSMALALVILATFYGIDRAYFAVAWVPLVLFLLVLGFQEIRTFQHLTDTWPSSALWALAWSSLVQGLVGVVLGFRAFHRRQPISGLLLATALVLIPFIVNTGRNFGVRE